MGLEEPIERLEVTAKEQNGCLPLDDFREGVVVLACVVPEAGWRPIRPNAVAIFSGIWDNSIPPIACCLLAPCPTKLVSNSE